MLLWLWLQTSARVKRFPQINAKTGTHVWANTSTANLIQCQDSSHKLRPSLQWGHFTGLFFSDVFSHSIFRLLQQIGCASKSSLTETGARWKLFGFCSLCWIINTAWEGALHKALCLQLKHSLFILSSGIDNTATYCGRHPTRLTQKRKCLDEWEEIINANHEFGNSCSPIINAMHTPIVVS